MAWGLWGSRLRSALTYGLKANVCYSLAAGLKEVGYGLGLKGCSRLWLTWGSRLRSALTYGLKAKV